MNIAVLALQGAFAEHEQMLHRLGAETTLIRNLSDWNDYMHSADAPVERGLVIPGGESTAMTRIMHDEQLWHPIRQAIVDGMPVFGTCAGMIMLDSAHLATMDIDVLRNAYGRQLGSFATQHEVEGLGTVPMTFIRAPYIERVGPEVETLSILDGHIIAARQHHQLVCSFHPELTDDTRMHEAFLQIVASAAL